MTIPGQAARGGTPSRRIRQMTPSVTVPASSRPSASAPGEYSSTALRIETKAEAHSTTVTTAAASARRSTFGAAVACPFASCFIHRTLGSCRFARHRTVCGR
jgi:hypothetical protein